MLKIAPGAWGRRICTEANKGGVVNKGGVASLGPSSVRDVKVTFFSSSTIMDLTGQSIVLRKH